MKDQSSMEPRILVLSASVGAGHLRAAEGAAGDGHNGFRDPPALDEPAVRSLFHGHRRRGALPGILGRASYRYQRDRDSHPPGIQPVEGACSMLGTPGPDGNSTRHLA